MTQPNVQDQPLSHDSGNNDNTGDANAEDSNLTVEDGAVPNSDPERPSRNNDTDDDDMVDQVEVALDTNDNDESKDGTQPINNSNRWSVTVMDGSVSHLGEEDDDPPTTTTSTTDPNQSQHQQQEGNEEEKENEREDLEGAEIAPKRKYPNPFYCSWTDEVMLDPVVIPTGESHERNAVVERDTTIVYYHNRALKSIIEYEKQQRREEGTMLGSVRKMDESIRSSFQQLLDQSSVISSSIRPVYRPLPHVYYCPITQEIMYDPVIDPDGNTFERTAILEWVRTNNKSPITRNEYSTSNDKPISELFYDNTALSDLVKEETHKDEDHIHPSIRRWKTEVSTNPPTAYRSNTPSSSAGGAGVAEEDENIGLCGLCCCLIVLLILSALIPGALFYFLVLLLLVCIKLLTMPIDYSEG